MKQTKSAKCLIKPLLGFAILMSLLLMIQTCYAKPSDETLVKIEPYSSSANVGETFTVNITVVSVQNLYGLEANLYWNSSILQVEKIDVRLGQTDGVLHNSVYVVENSTQKDRYVLAATSTAPAPPFNGNGNMVSITFKVSDAGNCELCLESQLYDYPPPDRDPRISLPIQHTTIDGSFSITIPEITPTISLLALMILTALSTILSKKTFLKARTIAKNTF